MDAKWAPDLRVMANRATSDLRAAAGACSWRRAIGQTHAVVAGAVEWARTAPPNGQAIVVVGEAQMVRGAEAIVDKLATLELRPRVRVVTVDWLTSGGLGWSGGPVLLDGTAVAELAAITRRGVDRIVAKAQSAEKIEPSLDDAEWTAQVTGSPSPSESHRALRMLAAVVKESRDDALLRSIYEHARQTDDPVRSIVSGLAEVSRERRRMQDEAVSRAIERAPVLFGASWRETGGRE